MRLFGTSGIRGVVGELLTPDFCRDIGQALGSYLPPGSRVCLATDTRLSRDLIGDAVIDGLRASGINVVHLGILPTPALAFLTHQMGFMAGLMITASHNPPEYNGIKVFNGDTLGYSIAQEDEVEAIYRKRNYRTVDTASLGAFHRNEAAKGVYFERVKNIFSGVDFRRDFKVVIDPGNGAASQFVSELFSHLGVPLVSVNDEPDGHFPGRPSEPTGETLKGTVEFLKAEGADLAICFDGDADRVVFCDRDGFLGFTEMVTFISRLIIQRNTVKTVAATIEVGNLLDIGLKDLGAQVVRGKVGDVHLAHLVHEYNAAIGVEDIGVYILPEIGWYPESIVAALTLLANIDHPREIRAFLENLPAFWLSKKKVYCPDKYKEMALRRIAEKAPSFKAKEINTLDGIRLDFDDSWMLIRASGTEPIIRVMAESSSKAMAEELANRGIEMVNQVVSDLGEPDTT